MSVEVPEPGTWNLEPVWKEEKMQSGIVRSTTAINFDLPYFLCEAEIYFSSVNLKLMHAMTNLLPSIV